SLALRPPAVIPSPFLRVIPSPFLPVILSAAKDLLSSVRVARSCSGQALSAAKDLLPSVRVSFSSSGQALSEAKDLLSCVRVTWSRSGQAPRRTCSLVLELAPGSRSFGALRLRMTPLAPRGEARKRRQFFAISS